MVTERNNNLVTAEEFHSRKTDQMIQWWAYGRITDENLIRSLLLLYYPIEVILGIIYSEE